MMIVGLTGGIGSGKTTVAGFFSDLGVPVYNSDREAKKLMQSSEQLRSKIIEVLGEEAYEGKNLNKKFIASMVFDNDNLLDELNRLVHPAVKRHFLNWAGKQRSAYVIQEAAILFENGSYKDYDKMILVTAPLKLRMDRLKERDGSSEAQIKARMKKQWKDSKKSDLTDFIIHNTDLKRTKSQVDRIHKKLLKTSRWGQF